MMMFNSQSLTCNSNGGREKALAEKAVKDAKDKVNGVVDKVKEVAQAVSK